ncbi:hypothetical protein FKM82_012409 [Ascaphus truei]
MTHKYRHRAVISEDLHYHCRTVCNLIHREPEAQACNLPEDHIKGVGWTYKPSGTSTTTGCILPWICMTKAET